jgi:hypothetical protein
MTLFQVLLLVILAYVGGFVSCYFWGKARKKVSDALEKGARQ